MPARRPVPGWIHPKYVGYAYYTPCMRYIELNPVRAGMVEHPGEYRWSSYSVNANGADDSIIRPHHEYLQLGMGKPERLFAYRELFCNALDKNQVHQIREALNQELVTGREDFKDKIEQMTQRKVRRGKDGRPRVEYVKND